MNQEIKDLVKKIRAENAEKKGPWIAGKHFVPYAGTYYGTYKTRFAAGVAEAQIRALGGGKYDGFMILRSVKDGPESIMTISKLGDFQVDDGKAIFHGNHPNDFGHWIYFEVLKAADL